MKNHSPNPLRVFLVLVSFFLASCAAKYTTPGGSVNISELADEDIAKILSNKPAAQFPVNVAIARIQSPRYTALGYSRAVYANPSASYSMVLTRDAVEEEVYENWSKLEGIESASPFNRLLLPYQYKTIKDLRLAAAKMKAGMLIVYTFDTEYVIDTKNFGPQNAISLGYLKNKEVKVVTTASAAVFDVQTEYLYGLTEATARKVKKSNAWKKQEEVDALREDTEREAFMGLSKKIEELWGDILEEYRPQ